MDKKTFDEGLKLLKRFLKDEGLYFPIYKTFLFKNGARKKEDLFNEFNTDRFTNVDDWKVLFGRLNLMGYFDFKETDLKIFKKYEALIFERNLRYKWPEYYKERTKNG